MGDGCADSVQEKILCAALRKIFTFLHIDLLRARPQNMVKHCPALMWLAQLHKSNQGW